MSLKRENLIQTCFNGNVALQRAWHKNMWHGLKETDLSPTQLAMLFLVEQHQPVSGKDLAVIMRVSRSAVTQLLDILHNHNYISRHEDPSDRRISYIQLSTEGEKKLHLIHKDRKVLFTASTTTLTDSELTVMAAIQKKMINQIEG